MLLYKCAYVAGDRTAARALHQHYDGPGNDKERALFWKSRAEEGSGGITSAKGFPGLVFALGLQEKFEEWSRELEKLDPFLVDL